jgi:II/X family phage/plasmid replication protein
MIDTIRFKIPVSKELLIEIKKKSVSFVKRDNVLDEEWLRFLTVDVPLGSYDRKVTLFSYDDAFVYLECSLPKQYRGENVTLLYPSEIELALTQLHARLTSFIPCFPLYKEWVIIRLDLCYAWRLTDSVQAERLMEMLKLLEFPRKNKMIYKTSVMFRGRHYSLKFYHKYPEYLRNDFSTLVKIDVKKADELMLIAKNVLRFEVTYRHEQLKHVFEKERVNYLDLMDKKFLEQLLAGLIKKLLQNRSKESMSDIGIVQKLKSAYKTEKAMRLFNFYKSYYSKDEGLKQIQKSNYHKSTIWRNLKDISLADVGISNSYFDFDFNLLVPSDLVVNKDPGDLREQESGALGSISNTA